MNKQELKEGQKVWVRALYRGVDPEDDESLKISLKDKGGRNWVFVDADEVLVHHPPKVVVPQFVAEKIKYCKANSGYTLFHAMDYCFQFRDSEEWIECNEELFARAWLDGYTVEEEQERMYVVDVLGKTLCKVVSDNHVRYMMLDDNYVGSKTKKYFVELTESEIKAVDARLWPFAKEVE